jgi:hypothetical protein
MLIVSPMILTIVSATLFICIVFQPLQTSRICHRFRIVFS